MLSHAPKLRHETVLAFGGLIRKLKGAGDYCSDGDIVMLIDKPLQGLQLSNTLQPVPSATARVAGHLLKAYYSDMLDAESPEAIQALIRQLEAQERMADRVKHHCQ